MDDIQNICRSCLTPVGEFRSVFTSSQNPEAEIHFAEMMSACASVQITVGDGLPEQICLECANKTTSFYLFKLQCEKSDHILRERLAFKHSTTNDFITSDIQSSTNNLIETNEVDIQGEVVVKCESANHFPNDVVETAIPTINIEHVDEEYKIEEENNSNELKNTENEVFDCKSCPRRFTRNDLLWRHQIVHAMNFNEKSQQQITDNVEQTNECMVIIKTEDDVIYTCQDCGLIFLRKDELDKHLEMHLSTTEHKSTDAVCQVCSKKFSKRGQLNRHMKTHITVKAHVCKTCGRSFARPEQLKHHMNVHLGSKPHICDICFKGFNQISNLKDHLRTHNGERPFLCSTCGKGFNQLGNLRQHTIRHSGIKAHLCSTCGSGFASKGELSAHLRKHTGARPFVCSVCNHGFTTSSSLTKHKRIHSGEKPYECDVCKMKFSRSGILARHKRTHTGEKPYICKFCSKAFSQSNDLTSHLRIHTGEKPYICDACGNAFRQSSGLKAHKRTHIEKDSENNVMEHRRKKILSLFS